MVNLSKPSPTSIAEMPRNMPHMPKFPANITQMPQSVAKPGNHDKKETQNFVGTFGL